MKTAILGISDISPAEETELTQAWGKAVEEFANARLMRAQPDLLASLYSLMAECGARARAEESAGRLSEAARVNRIVDEARAALAKAGIR